VSRARSLSGLGPSIQNAFVPQDFDKALQWWIEVMGVGPFFHIPHVVLEDVRYKGQPSDIQFEMVIGYWGDVQVELIRQLNDAPSIYKAWLDEGREGLHHTLTLVEDMAQARALVQAAGGIVLQEAKVPGGGEVIYVDLGGGPGTMLELLKPSAGGLEFFDMMRAAAANWDGADPIRRLG
jgi:methylmalonyl-CoA/ethylmalonyl-CoA epimerase